MNANVLMNPEMDAFWGKRPCLRPPAPEIYEAANELSLAADAYLSDDMGACESYVVSADKAEIREWIESLWGSKANNPQQALYHRVRDIAEPVSIIPKTLRHETRMPGPKDRLTLIAKWGWNCAFCGIPLIDTKARNVLRKALGAKLRWGPANADKHSAFQCMTIEYDHVVPHAVGGSSDLANTVPCCGPCNCGKFNRTVKEMGLEDPRYREISKTDWDGLTRLTVSRNT